MLANNACPTASTISMLAMASSVNAGYVIAIVGQEKRVTSLKTVLHGALSRLLRSVRSGESVNAIAPLRPPLAPATATKEPHPHPISKQSFRPAQFPVRARICL